MSLGFDNSANIVEMQMHYKLVPVSGHSLDVHDVRGHSLDVHSGA